MKCGDQFERRKSEPSLNAEEELLQLGVHWCNKLPRMLRTSEGTKLCDVIALRYALYQPQGWYNPGRGRTVLLLGIREVNWQGKLEEREHYSFRNKFALSQPNAVQSRVHKHCNIVQFITLRTWHRDAAITRHRLGSPWNSGCIRLTHWSLQK